MKRAAPLLIALTLLAPARAGAEDPPAAPSKAAIEKARVYFDAGAQAYAAGRYAAAIQAFTEAYAIAPKPQIIFSLAQAERRLYTAERDPRHLKSAVEHFRRYLDEVPQGGRRADAVEALAELELLAARLDRASAEEEARRKPPSTRIMVSSQLPGAIVLLDGAIHEELPVIEDVTPGRHSVRVSAPGYVDEEREVVAVEGTLVPIEIDLHERPSFLTISAPAGARVTIDGRFFGEAPLAAKIALPPGTHLVAVARTGFHPELASVTLDRGKTAPVRVELRRTTQRTVAWVVAGASVAAAAAGGVLGLTALGDEAVAKGVLADTHVTNISAERLDQYNRALASRDAVRSASMTALGAAGALGLTAAGLFFFDNPTPPRDATIKAGSLGVSVDLGPLGGAIGLRGHF